MHKSPTKLTVAAALVASASVAVPAADAAVPKTGTWRGDLSHVLPAGLSGRRAHHLQVEDGDLEFEGRIQTVVATVRMNCPAVVGISDVRVLQSWRIGRGPRVSRRGASAFRADGAVLPRHPEQVPAIGGTLATYGDELPRRGPRFNLQRRW